jgi:ribosomal subunit interface protein
MTVHVYLTACHIGLTDAIRDYVESNLVDAVRSHTSMKITRMQVQLDHQGDWGNNFVCHVELEMPGHHDINIREEAGDLYAAIDVAKDRLLRALIDYRDRILTEKRHPVAGT